MELSLRDTQINNPFVGLIIRVSMTVEYIKPNVLREKCLMLSSLTVVRLSVVTVKLENMMKHLNGSLFTNSYVQIALF